MMRITSHSPSHNHGRVAPAARVIECGETERHMTCQRIACKQPCLAFRLSGDPGGVIPGARTSAIAAAVLASAPRSWIGRESTTMLTQAAALSGLWRLGEP